MLPGNLLIFLFKYWFLNGKLLVYLVLAFSMSTKGVLGLIYACYNSGLQFFIILWLFHSVFSTTERHTHVQYFLIFIRNVFLDHVD